MFERPQNNSEQCILVHINFNQEFEQEELQEFQELVLSAGAEPVLTMIANRQRPDVKYFVGSGKAEEIRQAVETAHVELVIFNHELSPAQERNLEKLFQARVLSRTALILDIFAQRARTFEGKLQVELAQLQHMATRLVRGWTHLERQKGGIGLRGPGETQLETDRRLLRNRIKAIKQRLEKVREQRAQNRQSRQRKPVPTVSIVGYTNAGKSTLFNALTQANVYAANQLFATLDPTLRRIELPEVGEVVLADTVGFIRHLPHDLIDAFRATLEETRDADLLLHVIDFPHPQRTENIAQVEVVLKEIGAAEVPQLRVYNKIDLLPDFSARIDADENSQPTAVYVSAQEKLGLKLLTQAIVKHLAEHYLSLILILTPVQAKLRAMLYANKSIIEETQDEAGNWHIKARMSRTEYAKWLAKSE